MVREAASFIRGGGGGQKNFASAGGKTVDGLNAAFEAVLKHFQ
jgi:alanyl-tRNA synthetase